MFGEDVGPKGAVHGATLGLQEKFGRARVFDTSLVGRRSHRAGRRDGARGASRRSPEIQFRKYADPAAEQLNDSGAMRWRTNNRFAAPIVVRMPGAGSSSAAIRGTARRTRLDSRRGLAGRHDALALEMRSGCCRGDARAT